MTAVVTSYTGYRVSDTEGRVEFEGSGFGAVPGRVNLVQNREHVGGAVTVVSWSDTKIVVATPAYADYRHYMIVPVGSRPAIGTNLNPQISTSLQPGLLFDTASSPAPSEFLLTGFGFAAVDRLDLALLVIGAPHFFDPAGPNAIFQRPTVVVIEWSDTVIHFSDSYISGRTAGYLITRIVGGTQNGLFDFPDFVIVPVPFIVE